MIMHSASALLLVTSLVACATPASPRDDERGAAATAAPASPADQLAELGYHGPEAGGAAAKARGACPGAEDGRELVGHAAPPWQLTDWVQSEPLELEALRGRVVVVRFWTAGCPFCEKAMPALQALSRELAGEPVTFVGAFHGKPESSAPDMSGPLALAKTWGVTFPLALDREWKTLRAWWLDGHHRHASSATFVIGKDGTIAHVHPGPVYHPSDDPAAAAANRDYLALRQAILDALAR